MTQLEPRLSYNFSHFPTTREYTTYAITERGIEKCQSVGPFRIKTYTTSSHSHSEEDISRVSLESNESGYQSGSPLPSLETCKTPMASNTHPVDRGKRSRLKRKQGKSKGLREGTEDVTCPKPFPWSPATWRQVLDMVGTGGKEDVMPLEAHNNLYQNSSLLGNIAEESFVLTRAYKNPTSQSYDLPPLSPSDGRRATVFYEEEDVPECPPQVPTYVMEKSVIRHPQEIFLQVASHKAIQSEPSLVCIRRVEDLFESDDGEDVSESESESEEEESKSEEEESESEEDVVFRMKEEFVSDQNEEKKTENEEIISETKAEEAFKTINKTDTPHSNSAEVMELRHKIKVMTQRLKEIDLRDRQRMEEVLKSPNRTKAAPQYRETEEEVEVLELRNRAKLMTQNVAELEPIMTETVEVLEPQNITKLEPMTRETVEVLEPRHKAKLMIQSMSKLEPITKQTVEVLEHRNRTKRMTERLTKLELEHQKTAEVLEPKNKTKLTTHNVTKQEPLTTETADVSQPRNKANVIVHSVNKSEPQWKETEEASQPQRKGDGVCGVSNRLFERRGRSKDPLAKGMKKLRRLVRVYVTEDIDEPPFQYVPEVLPSSATIKGMVPPLQESLMLLGEGLEAGSLVAQFEQLYRRKPGLTVTEARRQENEKKNRYRDISPYDTTRVTLTTSPSGDYINASYVNMEVQASGIVNRYIASQGPLAGTCADFWYMVWEQQSTLIVMLTTVVEQGRVKCHRYWPRLYETVDFGILQVTCNKEEETPGFAFREFTLINTETQEERHITHMQYLAWPDHGVPDDSTEFLNFVTQVRKARVGMVEPTIVHCSAGIGRTGVLILMETAQCLIEANEPIYPLDIVKAMRDQRAMMIQTASQFRFVCEAIHRVYTEELVKPLAEYEQR
ncbi:uncharacterized protein LOC126980589 isoform X5 [Eriocheir sinensis]|uniref:uncharacterized protein LOC126980589 isoform X5 n=1 Tax=Eriocheir sinensis TaxID=95602 RepID=UPI0021C6BF0B|nr:uncharacterized protein LOC126980589 isoform X5 [Eriocheir sinensis]